MTDWLKDLPELPHRYYMTMDQAREAEMRLMAGFPVGDEETNNALFLLDLFRSSDTRTEP